MMVKVCGMRSAQNIAAVEGLGIDLMGFIFYPPSSRYVAELPSYLPSQVARVGVFVNESLEVMRSRVGEFALNYLQLHGDEPVEVCRAVQEMGVQVIKAISIATVEDLAKCTPYDGVVDLLLFDTKTPLYGGSGKQFDWSILQHYSGTTPFLLSGGINLSHAGALQQLSHPQLVGFDLNSGFEIEPALKDVEALKQFIQITKDR